MPALDTGIHVQQHLVEDTVRPFTQHGLIDRGGVNCVSDADQTSYKIFVPVSPPACWMSMRHGLEDQVFEEMKLGCHFPDPEVSGMAPTRKLAVHDYELPPQNQELRLEVVLEMQALRADDVINND